MRQWHAHVAKMVSLCVAVYMTIYWDLVPYFILKYWTLAWVLTYTYMMGLLITFPNSISRYTCEGIIAFFELCYEYLLKQKADTDKNCFFPLAEDYFDDFSLTSTPATAGADTLQAKSVGILLVALAAMLQLMF